MLVSLVDLYEDSNALSFSFYLPLKAKSMLSVELGKYIESIGNMETFMSSFSQYYHSHDLSWILEKWRF
jgi:hypothetical protein